MACSISVHPLASLTGWRDRTARNPSHQDQPKRSCKTKTVKAMSANTRSETIKASVNEQRVWRKAMGLKEGLDAFDQVWCTTVIIVWCSTGHPCPRTPASGQSSKAACSHP